MVSKVAATNICKFKNRKWCGFQGKNKIPTELYKDMNESFGVYRIRDNGWKGTKSKYIYIGSTGLRGKKKSIKNRLATHLRKATGEKDGPKNWKRYKKTRPQTDQWTIEYQTFNNKISAKAAEVALIVQHVITYGHAPFCNDEYVKGMKYSKVIAELDP